MCDDGNLVDDDYCSNDCSRRGACGDFILQPGAGERCDDGNVMDGDGCSASCELENAPPDCALASPSRELLWPPNHELESISIEGVTDPDGDPITVTIRSIWQDEPVEDSGDGSACSDADGIGSDTASVRAERAGGGDGRVYHIGFDARDGGGGECAGTVQVCVPHDRRRRAASCGDQGPQFDSTESCEEPQTGPACGLGYELILVLLPVAWRRVLRRAAWRTSPASSACLNPARD